MTSSAAGLMVVVVVLFDPEPASAPLSPPDAPVFDATAVVVVDELLPRGEPLDEPAPEEAIAVVVEELPLLALLPDEEDDAFSATKD